MKTCSSCGSEKDESEFHRDSKAKDGRSYHCKSCTIARAKKHHVDNREHHMAQMKANYWKDRESNLARHKEWASENKEHLREYRRRWRAAHPNYQKEMYRKNRDKILEGQKEYTRKNRDKILAKHKAYRNNPAKKKLIADGKLRCYNRKRRTDPGFRILRRRIHDALAGRSKSASTAALLGCSIEEFKVHLENQFTEGMTWDNYGEWVLDHIKPCVLFDFTDPDQQRECFHFSNHQPLWQLDNLAKGDSYPTAPQSAAP